MPESLSDLGVHIPLGAIANLIVRDLQSRLAPVWDLIGDSITALIDGFTGLLLAGPPFLVTAVMAAVAWRVRGRGFAVFTAIVFMLLDGMGEWEAAMHTLGLVMAASSAAVIIGIPIGIMASRYERLSGVIRPLLDFMQTLPAFVYLIPAVFFWGVGKTIGAVATMVFAMPPAIRLTELGIRQVPWDIVEAGHAFGSTRNQILLKIQLPLALPTIMAGVNQVIMLSLSMVVIAGMVGAPGLGAEVVRSLSRLNVALGFQAGFSVVLLAIFLDRIMEGFASSRSHKQV